VAQEKGQVGVFGGGSWLYGSNFRTDYPAPNTLTPYTWVPGSFLGIRVREMLSTHFGLEQSVTVLGNNNMAFGPTFVGTRTNQFYFNDDTTFGNYNLQDYRFAFSGPIACRPKAKSHAKASTATA
jgi:hypothetical protein